VISDIHRLSFRHERDHKPRSAHIAWLGTDDILGSQGTAMRLNDLASNGEAQAGILPECLLRRAIRVEALKNPLNAIRTNARPIVIDGQDDVLAASRQREPDLPRIFWHKGARILNEVGHDLTKPQVVA